MKTNTLLPASLACLVPCLVRLALADPIQLQPATNIYAAGLPLDVGDYAIPCVADWNGDGKKDLLVGYQTAGKIALYTNAGSDWKPGFQTAANLQAAGTDLVHTSSGCGAPAPWVCDYDGDGRRDLLVGAGADGTVWFYRNTNTDACPILAAGLQLMVGVSVLSVPLRATPYVYDWDGDGVPDLLCGAGDGYVYYFRNSNTAQAPVYAASVRLTAGGALLNPGPGIRSVIRLCDWDGDGKKDLIYSSSAGVYWCRNTNSAGLPALQAAVPLKVPSPSGSLTTINTGPRMRLDLVDWNNDGVMDLILGNADGTVFLYAGYRFAFAGSTRCNGGQVALAWNSAPYLKYDVLAGSSLTNLATRVATNLVSTGTSTRWTNRPAAPAQFYRLQIVE
jgi:hypothetical protein